MSNLIQKDDLGNWGVKGLPWSKLNVGQVITREVHEKIYGCLYKLMEYEDTELSPEQVEKMVENLVDNIGTQGDAKNGKRFDKDVPKM